MRRRALVLQVGPLPAHALDLLGQHFDVVADQAIGAERPSLQFIRGIATSGKAVVTRDLVQRLPDLAMVSCLGAGTDGLDLEALAERRVSVATTSVVLADDVADVAIGLVIALARDFRGADRFVREGRWAAGKYPLGQALKAAKLGILGLGVIGTAVAKRAAAFGMEIGYHNRSPNPDASGRYFDSLASLAEWCRFLVVCCPGGPATRHLVDTGVLKALGPDGWLINVARGSVVNEQALGTALAAGIIAGAGLDVFEDEPTPVPALLERDNVILLPHIGSATGATRDAMAQAMVEALVRALA